MNYLSNKHNEIMERLGEFIRPSDLFEWTIKALQDGTLPNVKEEEIKATYENGVLKLNVAKQLVSAPKAKEIAIS